MSISICNKRRLETSLRDASRIAFERPPLTMKGWNFLPADPYFEARAGELSPARAELVSAVPCRVSVIVPVFNSAATVPRAAASVLGQTLRELELLIVDDGSDDGSATVAETITRIDPRVRLIALPKNVGKARVLNLAMAEARGEWIAVLDADDEFKPDRLTRLLSGAATAGVDLVADNQYLYDSGAARVVGVAMAERMGARELTRASFAAGCDPYASFDLGMLKPVVRAEFIRRAGLSYRENARLSEDFLFFCEFLAAGGRALLVNQPLYVWTQAYGSLSRRWTATAGGPWRYDFASAVRAHHEVGAVFATRGEPILAALLARRARAFGRLMWLNEAGRRRDESGSVAAAVVLTRHPSAWPALLRRLWRAWEARGFSRHGAEPRSMTVATGGLALSIDDAAQTRG